ncbi:MAG: class I SAM-dependent methyltransferase [Oligoflexia bacterium]|nr:class I SAM-dependent methyltransferase [Oligoflexia bacterium]
MNKNEELNQQYQRIISKLGSDLPSFSIDFLLDLPVGRSFVEKFNTENQAQCLELGVGTRSSLVDLDWLSLTGLDLSSVALENANFSSKIEADFLHYNDSKSYDLIIDSHLFHTFDNLEDITLGLNKSLGMLKAGGMIIGEFPVSHHSLINNSQKVVLPALEWEKLLIECSKNNNSFIGYFTIVWGLKMILDDSGENRDPQNSDPDVLRYILIKE